MNTIFLTSQASEVLERIVNFLPKKPNELRVVFIPTAANPYSSSPWIEKDRTKLVSLGFSVENLDLEHVSESEVRIAVDAADIIFVGGGNTFFLLQHAKKSGFIEIAREAVSEGKIYIGSSAGSVLAAPDIQYVELFDEPGMATLEDTKALGIVPFRILPHFGNPAYSELYEKVAAEYQAEASPLVPVKDNQFLLRNGDLQMVETTDTTQKGV